MSSRKIKIHYKRWFAVSQDINRDPDMVELRHKFGAIAVLVWQEFLSIGARNQGYIPGKLSALCASIGPMMGIKPMTVALIYGFACERRMIVFHNGGGLNRSRYIANWKKYNRDRGISETPQQPPSDPLATHHGPIGDTSETPLETPRLPIGNYPNPLEYNRTHSPISGPSTQPTQPTLHIKESTLMSETLSVSDFCESWNEYFEGKLPRIKLPLAASREKKLKLRLRDHPELAFWQEVFKGIWASDFLMGRNGNDWRASFDWLIDNDKNCLKVAEGNYVNKDSARVR